MATDIDSCRRKCTRIFVLLYLCVYCFSHGDDLRSEDSIRWTKAEECFSKAVESIEMRCKDMNTGTYWVKNVWYIEPTLCGHLKCG